MHMVGWGGYVDHISAVNIWLTLFTCNSVNISSHSHTLKHMHAPTLTALPVPDPPLSVQVTSVTTITASVTWSAPPFDPTNRISFYNLTVGEDTFGLPDIEVMYTGLTFQYTFTRLEEYVNYTCDVISVGVFGTFSAPASANFTTLEAGS